MICANEISIIYGGRKSARARAGQKQTFSSEPTRKKLIYDLFSSYFTSVWESFRLCRESEATEETETELFGLRNRETRACESCLWCSAGIHDHHGSEVGRRKFIQDTPKTFINEFMCSPKLSY